MVAPEAVQEIGWWWLMIVVPLAGVLLPVKFFRVRR